MRASRQVKLVLPRCARMKQALGMSIVPVGSCWKVNGRLKNICECSISMEKDQSIPIVPFDKPGADPDEEEFEDDSEELGSSSCQVMLLCFRLPLQILSCIRTSRYSGEKGPGDVLQAFKMKRWNHPTSG